MATSDERLEVAEDLRYTANDDLCGESLQRALARISGAEDTSWRGVMRRLADLIDPTCEVQSLSTAGCAPSAGTSPIATMHRATARTAARGW